MERYHAIRIWELFALDFQLTSSFNTKLVGFLTLFVDFFKLNHLVESHFSIILNLSPCLLFIPAFLLLVHAYRHSIFPILPGLTQHPPLFLQLLNFIWVMSQLHWINQTPKGITFGPSCLLFIPPRIFLSPSISRYLFCIAAKDTSIFLTSSSFSSDFVNKDGEKSTFILLIELLDFLGQGIQ